MAYRHLETLGKGDHQGICAPLFCLRTKKSQGIGDFGDLCRLIDLAAKAKLKIIQLLPMNDTQEESSPYSAISAFALNPIYIDITALESPPKSRRLQGYEKHLKELDRKDRLHYRKVREYKLKWLRLYFEKKGHLKKIKEPIKAFAKSNSWVKDYALFCSLKDYHDRPWWRFPKTHQHPTPSVKKQLMRRFNEEIAFILFVQWVGYEQLKNARLHAEKKKVYLKGDVPFLLVKDSCDVWLHPKCFHLTRSTGTPPDRFNRYGQNWGFPPYDWKKEKRGCLDLWRRRLRWGEEFYHLYRLDHAIGFFRLWTCYPNKHPKYGTFVPRSESSQMAQGRELLEQFLKMSPLLPVAEDLGLVTKEMQETFTELGIPGTRVTKEMRHSSKAHYFYPPEDYPRLTMTTAGTHDMQVLAQWWRDNKRVAKHYAKNQGWTYEPDLKKEQLRHLLRAAYRTNSFMHISLLDEFLALFPKYVPICLDRRQINIPGSWGDHNWTYRFVPTLEQLLADATFIRTLRSITKS